MQPPFRLKPWYLRWFTTADVWVTICPWVNVPSETAFETMPEVGVHERVHLERQKQTGCIVWLWSYFFNRGFRLEEECLGIAAEVACLPTRVEQDLRISRYAYQLNSSMYRYASPSPQAAEASIRAAMAALTAPSKVSP